MGVNLVLERLRTPKRSSVTWQLLPVVVTEKKARLGLKIKSSKQTPFLRHGVTQRPSVTTTLPVSVSSSVSTSVTLVNFLEVTLKSTCLRSLVSSTSFLLKETTTSSTKSCTPSNQKYLRCA